MKIALVDELHQIKKSGVYHATEALATGFRKAGIDTTIYSIKRRGKLFNTIIGIPYVRDLLFLPAWNYWLVKKLHKNPPDVIVYKSHTPLLFQKRDDSIKKVIVSPGPLTRSLKMIAQLDLPLFKRAAVGLLKPLVGFAEKKSMRKATTLIVLRKDVQRHLEEMGVARQNFIYVRQMLSLKPPQAALKIRKKYDLAFVGRLSKPKNWPMMEALAKAGNYKVVALSPQPAKLDRIDPNITIKYGLPHNEIYSVYAAAKLFVMPSLIESAPLVTLEAMAVGLPVIASPEGAADFVVDGENGYIVSDNKVESYLKFIKKLLADKALYAKISHNNQLTVRDYFEAKVVEDYIKVFKSMGV